MKSLEPFLLILLCIICQNAFVGVDGSAAAEKDLTLTAPQKRQLDKFKNRMGPALRNDYARKEAYLIRWLRASGFDIKKAETMLLNNLQWRKKLDMDTIQNEDWAEFAREFPYYFDSVSKEFEPVLTSHMGDWDFRNVILGGRRDKMLRYIYKMLEDLDTSIQKQQEKGRFVTRGNIIVDVDGYNLMQHACVQCFPLYLEMIYAMDKNYPGLFDKIVLVNVPSTFETLLNIMKQAMSPDTKNALQVFGTNRRTWQNYLLELVEEDQLPIEFGGNLLRSLKDDFQDND